MAKLFPNSYACVHALSPSLSRSPASLILTSSSPYSSIRPFDRHDWTIHRPTASGAGGSSYMSGGATQPYTARRCASSSLLSLFLASSSSSLTPRTVHARRRHRLLPPPERRGRQPGLLARRAPGRRRPRGRPGAHRQVVGPQEGDRVWLGRREQPAAGRQGAGGAVRRCGRRRRRLGARWSGRSLYMLQLSCIPPSLVLSLSASATLARSRAGGPVGRRSLERSSLAAGAPSRTARMSHTCRGSLGRVRTARVTVPHRRRTGEACARASRPGPSQLVERSPRACAALEAIALPTFASPVQCDRALIDAPRGLE